MFDENDYMKKPEADEVFEYGQGRGGYLPRNIYDSDRQRDMEYLLLQRQLKNLAENIDGKISIVKRKYKTNLVIAIAIMAAIAFVMSLIMLAMIDHSKDYEILKAQLISEIENLHEYKYNVSGDSYETTIASMIYDRQINSVVIIESSNIPSSGNGAAGTGIVIDIKGNYAYILTNWHVISYEFGVSGKSQAYNNIMVKQDSSQTVYSATKIVEDTDKDLAVIRINNPPAQMKRTTFALTASIKLGDYAVVLGNAAGLGISVTAGIFSNIISNANYMSGVTLVQTNAAVNPGNSGGPLYNAQGLCVGIVTLKKTYDADDPDTLGFEGMGFAVASDAVKVFIDSLENNQFTISFA